MRSFLVLLLFAIMLASQVAWADSPACALLSQAQASAIFGQALQPGQDMTAPETDLCIFAGTAADAGITVALLTPGDETVTQGMYRGMTSPAAGSALTNSGQTPVPVSGLGESATYQYSDSDYSLWILAGTKIYGLDANQSTRPDIKAALIAAGHKLIAP